MAVAKIRSGKSIQTAVISEECKVIWLQSSARSEGSGNEVSELHGEICCYSPDT